MGLDVVSNFPSISNSGPEYSIRWDAKKKSVPLFDGSLFTSVLNCHHAERPAVVDALTFIVIFRLPMTGNSQHHWLPRTSRVVSDFWAIASVRDDFCHSMWPISDFFPAGLFENLNKGGEQILNKFQ
jgi:hypothetical protein